MRQTIALRARRRGCCDSSFGSAMSVMDDALVISEVGETASP